MFGFLLVWFRRLFLDFAPLSPVYLLEDALLHTANHPSPMPAHSVDGQQKTASRAHNLIGRFNSSVIALLLITIFFSVIRWRLASTPLERDEGEYAYAGQLILKGIPPYEFAYSMKLPGTYAAYAAIMAVLLGWRVFAWFSDRGRKPARGTPVRKEPTTVAAS